MYSWNTRTQTPRLALAVVLAGPALAGSAEWKPSLSIGGTVTLTDNVRLRPSDSKESDVYTIVTPSFGVDKDGARLKVNARYSPSLVWYAAGTVPSSVRNSLNGKANLEVIENFFYVDARANIFQSFLSPFGPQPGDLGSQTANRTETTTLGIAPYIRGRLPGGSQYSVRDDLNYTTFSTSGRPDIYGNSLAAEWNGVGGTFLVPSLDYTYNSVRYGTQPAFVSQVARLRATANLDTDLQLFATGGYESNDFVFSQQQGTIYGGGFNWKPSPRTDVRANVERRFFGNSYNIDAVYRTAFTAWSVRADRQIRTSQQQFQQFTNASTSGLRSSLDALFAAQIPDPIQRAAFIDQFLAQNGFSSLVGGPTPIFTPRVLLVESIDPSVAIRGSRTTVTLSVFYRKTTPLSEAVATDAVDPFATFNTVTQRGGSALISHKIDPMLTTNLSVNRIYTEGAATRAGAPAFESVQTIFNATLARQISPSTYGSVGLRWQVFNSDSFADYRERAVLATVTHTFF